MSALTPEVQKQKIKDKAITWYKEHGNSAPVSVWRLIALLYHYNGFASQNSRKIVTIDNTGLVSSVYKNTPYVGI
jgi:hypothetical protein